MRLEDWEVADRRVAFALGAAVGLALVGYLTVAGVAGWIVEQIEERTGR